MLVVLVHANISQLALSRDAEAESQQNIVKNLENWTDADIEPHSYPENVLFFKKKTNVT